MVWLTAVLCMIITSHNWRKVAFTNDACVSECEYWVVWLEVCTSHELLVPMQFSDACCETRCVSAWGQLQTVMLRVVWCSMNHLQIVCVSTLAICIEARMWSRLLDPRAGCPSVCICAYVCWPMQSQWRMAQVLNNRYCFPHACTVLCLRTCAVTLAGPCMCIKAIAL